jgi:ribonuclease P protein component
MIHHSNRFHGLGSLRFLYKNAKVVRGPYLSLRFTPNARRSAYRLAVVVSRKVSKSAVKRNRIRRRLYEAMRSQAVQLNGVYDLAFMVYDERLATVPAAEITKTVKQLLRKAGITKKDNKTHPLTPGGHDIVEGKENR